MKTAAMNCTGSDGTGPSSVLMMSPTGWHIEEGKAISLIAAVFAVLIRHVAMSGDRTLNLWFG